MAKATKRVTTSEGRGKAMTTAAGASGQYVGTLVGVVWVAWNSEDFDRMCKAFDAQAKAK